ncbi:uncharacterized protein LOC142578327 [Dermacentor variabilis]|uniref:uncharacterized protein LOC142578327 n=1 Tax=Dermacentor variabilis TaxID=34621 RepID=UPI003F5C0FD3
MDISSRDSVIVVATFSCVNNFVIFLVHVFPPEGRFNNKEADHMVYIIGVKTFESAVSVIVDIMTIIGVWDMDKRNTTTRKLAHGYRQRLIAHLKEPKRALLLFIIWSITTSPASVGTDMVYNYHTSGSVEMFIMNAVIRCSIEAAKFYVLYRFFRLYNRLGAEDLPIVVEGATEATSPAVLALTAISGGSGTTGAEPAESRTGSAHFRRRTPYGAGSVPMRSIMGADTASEDPNLRGQGGTAEAQRRPSNRADRRGTTSHLNDIVQDAGAVTDGGLKLDVEHKTSHDSPRKAAPVRPSSRKQSYEFGGDASGSAGALGGKLALPERRSGRRLSIMSPAVQVANVLQPVPEAAPLPDSNVSTASASPTSPSASSVLKNQQDGSPRHYQKKHRETGEEEHVPEPPTAREDAPVLATAEAAERTAAAERPSALRRHGRGGHRLMTSASPSASSGSTPSVSPDKSAQATEDVTSEDESAMTTTTSTRRERSKSKGTSRRRSRSGDKSKTKHKPSKKHPHTSTKKSSPKMLSLTSSAESSVKSPADEFSNKQ